MKKTRPISALLAITLILSLLLSLCGCFSQNDDQKSYDIDEIPEYSGKAYVIINNNVPFFKEEEIEVKALENYEELDALGRCGVAYACIGIETMPTEKREDISRVFPSGWKYNNISNNKEYDFINTGDLYNRCHLIGFQLAGENANEKNLITGTRYLNIEGMLPFEDMIADYVEAEGNHVLYRVTPIFEGENLVASGVLMEGISIEDGGKGIKFCVYAFNVQPGVEINYFTGQNVASGEQLPPVDDSEEEAFGYIINKNSKTVHRSDCGRAATISEANKETFDGELELLLEEYAGYKPCRGCLPDLEIPAVSENGTAPDGAGTPESGGEGGTAPEDGSEGEGEISFIVNKNTKKYHLPGCSGAPTSETNRLEYSGSLEELKEEYPDYTQCDRCKPDENQN